MFPNAWIDENGVVTICPICVDTNFNCVSMSCPKCREEYKRKIKEVLKPEFNNLCEDCQNRYEKNPLRLLDCKVGICNPQKPWSHLIYALNVQNHLLNG